MGRGRGAECSGGLAAARSAVERYEAEDKVEVEEVEVGLRLIPHPPVLCEEEEQVLAGAALHLLLRLPRVDEGAVVVEVLLVHCLPLSCVLSVCIRWLLCVSRESSGPSLRSQRTT